MDPLVFSVPLRTLIMVWFGAVLFSSGAVFCSGMIAFMLFFAANHEEQLPSGIFPFLFSMAVFFWASALWHLRAAWILPRSAVIVDDDGIRSARPGRSAARVRWDEIASFHERPFLRRIELLDARGASLLRIEYQLGRLTDLLDILMETCPHTAELPPLPAAFRMPLRSLAVRLLPMVLGCLFFPAGWYSRIGPVWALILFIVLLIVGLWGWFSRPFQVVLHRDRLDARNHRSESTIYLEDASIRLVVTGQSDFPDLALRVDSTAGDPPLQLHGLNIGALDLARLLLRLKREGGSAD